MFRVRRLPLVAGVLVLLAAGCSPAHCSTAGRGTVSHSKEAGLKAQATQSAAAAKQTAQPAKPSAAEPAAAKKVSQGQILNSVAEFEIVNEGSPKASGDVDASAPTFMASIVASLFAVSGQDNVTENLRPDGDFGIWSLDAEQRFFWSPVDNGKPRVTIEGTAAAPKSITIRGRWGGPSDSVATIGRIGTRGVPPFGLPVTFKAPSACSYTWTDPASFCHVVYTGTLTASPSFAMVTTVGSFLEASLWQNAYPWMKYAEVKCTIDPASKGAPYEKDCKQTVRLRGSAKLLPIKVARP